MSLTYYVDGKWMDVSNARIPFSDAGFLLGDGLFETIRFQNGKLFKPDRHLARLRSGLEIIKIRLSKSDTDLINLMHEIILKNEMDSGLLRLMITRGELHGEPWKFSGDPCIYISIRPLSQEPEMPVKVVFFNEADYPIIRFTPAIKSMNYIGNMLAKKDAEKLGAYEPVFVNHNSIITECAIRNIFFIKNQTLLTPSTELGILPGVMRDTIMELARNMKLEIIETKIHKCEIMEMDEAFISSSGIGLYLCKWDNWDSDFTLTQQLKEKLFLVIN